MDMGTTAAPGFRAWAPADFAFIFTMWTVMMVGMMTPSVAPMVLLYAGVGRKAKAGGRPIASTAWFFTGYLLVWIAFSVAATGAQWLLARLALLSPMMATNSAVFGGVDSHRCRSLSMDADRRTSACGNARRRSRSWRAMAVSAPIRSARFGSASSMAPIASAAAGR